MTNLHRVRGWHRIRFQSSCVFQNEAFWTLSLASFLIVFVQDYRLAGKRSEEAYDGFLKRRQLPTHSCRRVARGSRRAHVSLVSDKATF
jgi:hypothetical protein